MSYVYIMPRSSCSTDLIQLTPQDLKPAVTNALISILEPIQADFQASPEWQEIEKKAYPPVEPEKKAKVKKVKNKGDKYPGAAKKVEAQPDGSVEGEGKQETDLGTSTADTLNDLSLAEDAVKKTEL